MDRQALLNRLDGAWLQLKDAYGGLSDAQMMENGVTGSWSVRDLLAHITTWEEEALKYLPRILNGERTPRYSDTYGGIDAFNAQTTERKKDLPLADVLSQLDDVHRQVVVLVETIPEEELRTETRFRRRLKADTYGHYPKHAEAIRKWRAAGR